MVSAKESCTELIDEMNDLQAIASASGDASSTEKEELLNKLIAVVNKSVDVNNDSKQLCRKVKGFLDGIV